MKGFIKAETIESSLDVQMKVERFDGLASSGIKKHTAIDFRDLSGETGFLEFAQAEKMKHQGLAHLANIRLVNEYETTYGLGFKILSKMEGFEIGKGLGKNTSGMAKPIEAVKKNYIGERDNRRETKLTLTEKLFRLRDALGQADSSTKLRVFEKHLTSIRSHKGDIQDLSGFSLSATIFDRYNEIVEKAQEDKSIWFKQLTELKDKIEFIQRNVEEGRIASSKMTDFRQSCVEANGMRINTINDVNKWLDVLYRLLEEYSVEFLESKFIYYCIDKLKALFTASDLRLETMNRSSESFFVWLFLFFDRYRNLFEAHNNIVNLSDRHFVEIQSFFFNHTLYSLLSKYVLAVWDHEDPAELVELFISLKKLGISFCNDLYLKLFNNCVMRVIEEKLDSWSGVQHGIIPFTWIIPWKQYVDLLPQSKSHSNKLSRIVTKKLAKLALVARSANDVLEYMRTVSSMFESVDLKYLIDIVIVPLWSYSQVNDSARVDESCELLKSFLIEMGQGHLNTEVVEHLVTQKQQ